MINSVVMEGRLTVDPVLKTTLDGKEFCTFSIAQNKKTKDGAQEAMFLDVSVWNAALAKYVADRFGKGERIVLQGKLDVRRYEASDGVKREAWQILALAVSSKDGERRSAAAGDFEEVG